VAAKDVHFLILPTYSRINSELPLTPGADLERQPRRDLIQFQLGYAQVISAVRRFTNHRIEVLDPYAEYVDMPALPGWLRKTYTKRELTDPDYFLIGGMSTSWPVIKQVVSAIKETFPKSKIICGGTAADLHHELLLRKLGVGIAVIGEGEFTTADLLHNLDDFSNVPGIAYLDENGRLVRNPPPPPHDLNDAPEPDWDSFDLTEYLSSALTRVGFKGLPINTSLGCPYACKFCFVPGGRNVRHLSTDNVVDRLSRMKDRFDLDYVAFYDDILFVDKDWMWELGQKLLAADLKLMWTCNTRVDLFSEKDDELLALLRKTGLVRMSFGIETGSPKILKNMGKTGVSPDKARAALRLVRRHGIRATASMLLGFPGETRDTIQESVDFCKEPLLSPNFYLLQPFPGTDVYDKYVREMYDEEAYLDLISDYREGEKLHINLTEIPTAELMELRDRAEAEIKKFHLGHYVRYYGRSTAKQAVVDMGRQVRRRINGSIHMTP